MNEVHKSWKSQQEDARALSASRRMAGERDINININIDIDIDINMKMKMNISSIIKVIRSDQNHGLRASAAVFRPRFAAGTSPTRPRPARSSSHTSNIIIILTYYT